jgi:hypothetical protein
MVVTQHLGYINNIFRCLLLQITPILSLFVKTEFFSEICEVLHYIVEIRHSPGDEIRIVDPDSTHGCTLWRMRNLYSTPETYHHEKQFGEKDQGDQMAFISDSSVVLQSYNAW